MNLKLALGMHRGQSKNILSEFTAPGDNISVGYYALNDDRQYTLRQHIGYQKYFTTEIYTIAGVAVGAEPHTIYSAKIQELMQGFNDTSTPAISFKNTLNWSKFGAASYPGGRFVASATTGEYIEKAIANSSKVGAVTFAGSTNLGLALVSIDGDNTLATGLPTAQELVTAGTFPDTILVANGGTLNPTDRVWDLYQRANNLPNPFKRATLYGNYTIFAEGLTTASHTVRITVTGYKRAASSAVGLNVCMIIGGGTNLGEQTTAPNVYINEANISSVQVPPVWEISYTNKPTGASGFEWLGHTGSMKLKEAPTFTVDGAPVTPTTLTQYFGATATLSQYLSVRNATLDLGTTEIGVMNLAYTITRTDGLIISHDVEWSTTGEVNGYPGMMTLDHDSFDRFNTTGNTAKDLTTNNDGVNLNSTGDSAWAWLTTGNYAMIMNVPDLLLTVENYTKAADRQFWWSDISANSGTWKKAYLTRYQGDDPHIFESGEKIYSVINYRAGWFSSGAASVFG